MEICNCGFHNLDAIEERFPALVRSMCWAAILSTGEAAAAIRDFKHGQGSGEAVSHFGGPLEVLRGAKRCRHAARKDYGPLKPRPNRRRMVTGEQPTMKKTTQPESMTFAGMEQAVKAQTAAAGEYTAEQLTQTMRQPLGDVSAKAGRIERDSPLFHGTGENPLLFGWDHPDAQPTVLLAPHHD